MREGGFFERMESEQPDDVKPEGEREKLSDLSEIMDRIFAGDLPKGEGGFSERSETVEVEKREDYASFSVRDAFERLFAGDFFDAVEGVQENGKEGAEADNVEPEGDTTKEDSQESEEAEATDVQEISEVLEEYFDDLKEKSECPETIPEEPFDVDDLEKRSPEENAAMREEFQKKKEELKREWEKEHGRPWPKYEKDVYSENGKLIRKAGSDYDAHHIQPLSMGGKNEASNITPLHAEVHYDKQGVHSSDSPYSKLEKKLGGSE